MYAGIGGIGHSKLNNNNNNNNNNKTKCFQENASTVHGCPHLAL